MKHARLRREALLGETRGVFQADGGGGRASSAAAPSLATDMSEELASSSSLPPSPSMSMGFFLPPGVASRRRHDARTCVDRDLLFGAVSPTQDRQLAHPTSATHGPGRHQCNGLRHEGGGFELKVRPAVAPLQEHEPSLLLGAPLTDCGSVLPGRASFGLLCQGKSVFVQRPMLLPSETSGGGSPPSSARARKKSHNTSRIL